HAFFFFFFFSYPAPQDHLNCRVIAPLDATDRHQATLSMYLPVNVAAPVPLTISRLPLSRRVDFPLKVTRLLTNDYLLLWAPSSTVRLQALSLSLSLS